MVRISERSKAVSPVSATTRAALSATTSRPVTGLPSASPTCTTRDVRSSLMSAKSKVWTPSSSLSNSSFPSYIETILPLSHSSDGSRIQSKSVGRPSGAFGCQGYFGVVGSGCRCGEHRRREPGGRHEKGSPHSRAGDSVSAHEFSYHVAD